MGWFTDVLQNLDRPSNALQGWITADDWLGLDEIKSGWNLEKNYDIEDAWRAEAQGERGWGDREGFLDHLSYAASVPFNLGLDPINAVGLGTLGTGLKATKNAAGKISPVGYIADRTMLSEMPNRLETLGMGFYDKGLASKVVTGADGALRGVARSINRELNPTMLKDQKLFKEAGVSTTTTSTIDNVMEQLNDPQLQAYATNLAIKGKNKLTGKEESFLKNWENLGKILQGQLGYNFMEKEAYQLATKLGGYKGSHFFSEALPLQKEYFIQGSKQFNNVADDAYKLSDDILGQVFDKIIINQGVKNTDKSRLYFKQPSVSNANAVRISNEVASGSAKKRKLVGELFKSPLKLKKTHTSASEIFGEGAKRIRYTDSKSGGVIEVVSKKDGTASVLELIVPEKFRGKGIGKLLQKQVMEDFPNMGGQVSSKAAAKTAYDLGRRPPNNPNATLDDVFKIIDEQSSVNLVIKNYKPKKGFNNIDELSEALSKKEWQSPIKNWKGQTTGQKKNIGIDHTIIKGKDGKEYAMFSESYLSGDNLLGGVNVVNLVDKNGKVFSFVSDAQDLFKFKFPGGQTPIVVTNPLITDFVKGSIKRTKRPPTPSKKGMMLGGHKKNPNSRPSASPQLYSSAQAIKKLQKDIHLNPLDYLSYIGKVNMATEPWQN